MTYILALTFLLAPTFLIRFSLFGVPLNFLMIWIAFVWVYFALWLLSKNKLNDFLRSIYQIDKKFLLSIGVLFFAATLSLFVEGIDKAKLGQYIVLFIQPISIFFIAQYIYKQFPDSKKILTYAFYLFLFVAGVYAVVQYYTLLGLPPAWWGNSIEPKRSLAFFAHPDYFALFITPVLGFLIPDVAKRLSEFKKSLQNLILPLAWLAGFAGLIYSLSRGGWLGFLVAAAVFVIISANKKYLIGALAVILVAAGFIYYIPNFRYRIILPLYYHQRSAFARFTVWDAGLKMIKDSPVLGKGLNGYGNNFSRYTTDPTLEHHNYPHQILLDFWVDTGLLGLIGFVGIYLYAFLKGLRNRTNIYSLGVCIFLAALFAHGLVDNPYFQNDLALIFWLVMALVV